MILAPDKGALGRARAVAERLGLEYSHFHKTRISPTEVRMEPVDVDVRGGRNVLIVDDIISTGGTMIRAANLLREMGAGKIFVAATHGGVFAEGGAIERVSRAVDELAVTNTIPTPRFQDKRGAGDGEAVSLPRPKPMRFCLFYVKNFEIGPGGFLRVSFSKREARNVCKFFTAGGVSAYWVERPNRARRNPGAMTAASGGDRVQSTQP